MPTIAQLGQAFSSTRAVLATVKPDDLDRPTPCASWDVRALINHFIGSARWTTATMGVDDAEADDLDGDFMMRYEQSVALAFVAFSADGALQRTVKLPFGDFSGAALLGLTANDQFTHGWDLARAIGHDTDLDPRLAEELLVQSRDTILDSYRGPDGVGLFAPAVDPPIDASPADRLAAFLGRTA